MTFEAGGKQYVAISTGLSCVSKNKLTMTPELRDMRNQTMLFVFGHIAKGGPANLVNNATLTRSDLIKFSN
jgi:hypothetical protein